MRLYLGKMERHRSEGKSASLVACSFRQNVPGTKTTKVSSGSRESLTFGFGSNCCVTKFNFFLKICFRDRSPPCHPCTGSYNQNFKNAETDFQCSTSSRACWHSEEYVPTLEENDQGADWVANWKQIYEAWWNGYQSLCLHGVIPRLTQTHHHHPLPFRDPNHKERGERALIFILFSDVW